MMAAASAPPPSSVTRLGVTVSTFTSSTSHAVIMPASVSAGDLLVAQIGIVSARAITTPAGWTLVDADGRTALETSAATQAVFARTADGSEGGTTVDFATTTACHMVASVHHFDGDTVTPGLVYAFGVSNINPNPDAPPIPVPWGATDSYAMAFCSNQFRNPYSTYPSGYSEGRWDASGAGSVAAVVTSASAVKQLSSAASEDPGAMVPRDGRNWVAHSVVVAPAGIASLDGASVEGRTGQEFTALTTAHNVNMPATVNVGDLLVAIFCTGSASTVTTITTPSGWTQLSQDAGGIVCAVGIFYRVADGTEGGTTVNFVTSAARRASSIVYRIAAGSFNSSDPIEVGPVATGVSTTPTIPAYSPSWGSLDTLTIAGVGADNLRAFVGRVSGYSAILQASGTSAISTYTNTYAAHGVYRNASTWEARLAITNAQTWVARAICIRPAP
jgi:hypothetical protein